MTADAKTDARLTKRLRMEKDRIRSVHQISGADLIVWNDLMQEAAAAIERLSATLTLANADIAVTRQERDDAESERLSAEQGGRRESMSERERKIEEALRDLVAMDEADQFRDAGAAFDPARAALALPVTPAVEWPEEPSEEMLSAARRVSANPSGFEKFSDVETRLIAAIYNAMRAAHAKAMPGADGWIPVTERLPEQLKTVLVHGGIAYWRDPSPEWPDGQWFSITALEWPGRPIQWQVTHWHEPLIPPVEEKKG